MQIICNWIKKQILFFCVLMGFIGGAYAVEVKIYQVELPTQNQNQAGNFDQAALLKQAFQTVLVRASGSDQFLGDPVIIKALAGVDQYINQFSYHQRSASEKIIRVVFNENRVNALLKSVKQSIWEKNRPLVLVWLGSAESEKQVVPELEKILNNRAIPFVFPLLDIADTTAVSDQDLLGENTASLEEAAKRYNPDVILSGHVMQQNGAWKAEWRFINKGDKTTWESAGSDLNSVLNESANKLTLKLRGRDISVAASSPEETITSKHLLLTVSGNLDAEQHARIVEYLRRLPDVSAVEVAEIMPDKMRFDIVTTQTKDTLANAIAEGHVLTKTGSDDALNYELAGVL